MIYISTAQEGLLLLLAILQLLPSGEMEVPTYEMTPMARACQLVLPIQKRSIQLMHRADQQHSSPFLNHLGTKFLAICDAQNGNNGNGEIVEAQLEALIRQYGGEQLLLQNISSESEKLMDRLKMTKVAKTPSKSDQTMVRNLLEKLQNEFLSADEGASDALLTMKNGLAKLLETKKANAPLLAVDLLALLLISPADQPSTDQSITDHFKSLSNDKNDWASAAADEEAVGKLKRVPFLNSTVYHHLRRKKRSAELVVLLIAFLIVFAGSIFCK